MTYYQIYIKDHSNNISMVESIKREIKNFLQSVSQHIDHLDQPLRTQPDVSQYGIDMRFRKSIISSNDPQHMADGLSVKLKTNDPRLVEANISVKKYSHQRFIYSITFILDFVYMNHETIKSDSLVFYFNIINGEF